MKTCIGCEKTKDLDGFPKNRCRSDGYGAYCKLCKRIQSQKYYEREFERVLKRNNRRKNEQRLRLWGLKSGPCADCGQTFHPYVMDFDHREGTEKISNVSAMARMHWSRVEAEIKKCDLVCSNCHRLRTLARAKGMPEWPV